MHIFEIQENFWGNVSCEDPFWQKQTLADFLCQIPALSSFVENFQEGLQVYLKGFHFRCFQKLLESLKKIGAAYENSNMFYKIFYANAETSKWPFFYSNEKLL